MALEQTISTTTGTSYTLAFYLGNNNGGGLNGTTSTVIAKVNGNTLFTAVNNQFNNDGTTKWVLFTGNFQATGTSTVISLQCGDPDTDTTDFIDNVSVTPTNT